MERVCNVIEALAPRVMHGVPIVLYTCTAPIDDGTRRTLESPGHSRLARPEYRCAECIINANWAQILTSPIRIRMAMPTGGIVNIRYLLTCSINKFIYGQCAIRRI